MQWAVSQALREDAIAVARTMLATNQDIRPVPFANGRLDIIFVTTNPNLVLGTDAFELEGTCFYYGCKT